MTEIQQRALYDLETLTNLLKCNGYAFFGPFGTDDETHIDDRAFFRIYPESNLDSIGEIVLFDVNQQVPHKVKGKYLNVIVKYEVEKPYQTTAALNLRKLLRANKLPYRESPNKAEMHRTIEDLGSKLLNLKRFIYQRSKK